MLLGCLGLAVLTMVSRAEDEPAKPSPSAEGQNVDALIDELNHDRFVTREKATEQLTKLGAKAVPALAKAANDKRPEVSERAFKILGEILGGGDEVSRTAARAKLADLAKSEKAGVAKVAKQILDREAEANAESRTIPRRGLLPGIRGGRIEIAPGGIRRLRIGGGPGVRRMRVVSGGDGAKEVEVTEGDRTVKIKENPTDGITVTVTETKDGKSITKEYKAADEKELKKKHPEGHKLYKQYAGGGGARIFGGRAGGLRLDLGRGGIGGGRIGEALPEEFRKRIEEELKRALPEGALPGGGEPLKELERVEAELRKLLEGGAPLGGGIPPEFKKMIEEFERLTVPREPAPGAEAQKAGEDDLDAAIAKLRETLKGSKDEAKMLEALKKLEKLQAEQLELLKKKQAEIEKKLKDAQ